jgi:hypothetical protein
VLTMLWCVCLSTAETLSNRDLKKKMSPTNAKALNTMRQRIKKHNSGEEMGQLVQKYRWGGTGASSSCCVADCNPAFALQLNI